MSILCFIDIQYTNMLLCMNKICIKIKEKYIKIIDVRVRMYNVNAYKHKTSHETLCHTKLIKH